jgi:hypothetical protein
MSVALNNLLTSETWLEERSAHTSLDGYKLGVAGVAAEVVLWSGESVAASFYLRLASASGSGRETLGERLNDRETRFIPCKIGDRVELLNLDWISYLRVSGPLVDIGRREELGAVRHKAQLTMQSGYVLQGELLYVLPAARSRVSDLLNDAGDRFLLFLAPAAAMYVNRSAIVRVIP